ncbi:MAG: hypothetical protein ACI4WS_08600 [Oscillospiraceae bacterium]
MGAHNFEYSEVLKLKAACAEHYPDHVHFHDGCGGQYFSLDEQNDRLREYICGYFAELGLAADFTGDGLVFTVRSGK